ncbi:MAG: hypothetical protein Q9M48_04575 [Rhodobacterales bacterium]|nr:hypothetical protein [Rhodobacterales bacterium]
MRLMMNRTTPTNPIPIPVVDPVTDPISPSAIEGTQNTDDLLTGSANNDTIIGNETDADTLAGGAGDDVLTLLHGNTGIGGEGADTFVMDQDDTLRFSPAHTSIQIDDFEVGVDTLEIQHEVRFGAHVQPHITVIEGANTILQIRDNANPDSVVFDEVVLTGTTGFSVDDLAITLVDGNGTPISTTVPSLSFATHQGTDGDDVMSLIGPNTLHQVSSGEGDDTVVSHSAIVTVDLGDGDDDYYGNQTLPDGYVHDTTENGVHGEDYFAVEIVDGGAGNDTIVSGNSNSRIDGGDGNDMIDILAHNYEVDGGAGDDRISIGPNSHGTAHGGDGDDLILGGSGDDRLFGDRGDDVLRGGGGDDVLRSGLGQDQLYGGDGDDRFKFSEGDTATGGNGADRFYAFRNEDGGGPIAPRITDFEADIDQVELELAPPSSASHSITNVDVTYDATTDETSIYADGVLSLVMEGDNTGLNIAFTNTQPEDFGGAPRFGYHDLGKV